MHSVYFIPREKAMHHWCYPAILHCENVEKGRSVDGNRHSWPDGKAVGFRDFHYYKE